VIHAEVCRSSLDSAADQFDVAGLMDQGRLRDSGLAACRALLDAMDPGAGSLGLDQILRRLGLFGLGSEVGAALTAHYADVDWSAMADAWTASSMS